MPYAEDFGRLDDTALLTWREHARAELARLTPGSAEHALLTAKYDHSTQIVNDRARQAWSKATQGPQP